MKWINFSFLLFFTTVIFAQEVSISASVETPIPYGIDQLEKSLEALGITLSRKQPGQGAQADILAITAADSTLFKFLPKDTKTPAKEGYALFREDGKTIVYGGDSRGVMYGLIALSDQLNAGKSLTSIEEQDVNPRFPFRAIKFNLPYMAYRSHASIAQHFTTTRDIDFWEKYLDMMAHNKFNVLSLWSLHLYHYMVIPEHFPEASQFTQIEMEEWRNFWSSLFKMAKDRGIETYIINWNTFTSPSFARVHNPDIGWYNERPWHFGNGDTTKITEEYTREIIKQVINEYPDLTGLGITLGERMGGQSADERRAWLDRTIFAGMRDADRKIKFVYRAPLSANSHSGGSTSEENDLHTRQQIEAMDTEGPVWVEFKYNWSHGHSSPNLFIVHGGELTDKYRKPLPQAYKYIWTVRNEDFFVHRWGQPDFVRDFIKNNGQEYVGGCFIGSEVFIPALDYTSKEGAHKNWEYSFERLWLWYATWGNLLYNPDTPDTFFENRLEERYGNALGEKALDAWKLAGKVPLHFASFHQGRNDLTLYTEGFTGFRENKHLAFFDIESFINHPVLDTIRYINIADYVKSKKRVKRGIIAPPALADSLDRIHRDALALVDEMSKAEIDETTRAELADIEAWSWYAEYFANKIRAGLALADYRINDNDRRKEAISYLEKCVNDWTRYADATTKYHKESFLYHTKEDFDWYGMLDYVNRDLDLAAMSNEAKERVSESEKIGGYLFAHMTKEDYGGIYYALSNDGLNWNELNAGKTVLPEYKGHPDLTLGHDGRYYLLGNPKDEGKRIKIWVSDDLIHWDVFKDLVPDMSDLPQFNEPTFWHGAPKMYYDEESNKYIITWHMAQRDREKVAPDEFWGSMRTLFTTTFDFENFTKPQLLFDEDIATIDVIIRQIGRNFYAVLKDERAPEAGWPTGKSIRLAKSNNVDGPYEIISEAISPNFREAPNLIPKPEGDGYYLYFEQYPGIGYEMSTASDIEGPWYDVYAKKFKFPQNARHGTMITLSKKIYDRLKNAFFQSK